MSIRTPGFAACRARVGRLPELTLDLAVIGITVARGQMDVRIDPDLREALIGLGWVPPEQARALLSAPAEPAERIEP